jgi:hypothetical protein
MKNWMKPKIRDGLVALLGVSFLAPTAEACPFCQSETADKVWAGIFDADFGYHLFALLAPFPVLIAILLFIYYGPPVSVHRFLERKSPQ